MSINRLKLNTNQYFSFLPKIQYGENKRLITNITTKFILENFENSAEVIFYPYQIFADETRPDITARKVFGNPKLDWVIIISNKLIDPLFEWPLTEEQFEKYIRKKYGSQSNATSELAFYRLNKNNQQLTQSQYDSLSVNQKKYWLQNISGNQVIYVFDNNLDYKLSEGGYQLLNNDELVYWSAVSKYQEEFEKNQDRRIIRIVKPEYLDLFVNSVRNLFA